VNNAKISIGEYTNCVSIRGMQKIVFALFLVSITAPAASAQTGKLVAVGAGITLHKYGDNDFTPRNNPSVTFDYRISLHRHSRQGWKWEPKGGFSWFHADTELPVGGVETSIGELRARPIMGGIERAYRDGPLKVGVSIIGGPSFNHFSVNDAARAAYAGRLGQDLTAIKAKNSFALRPEFSAWYDLNQWIALHAAVNYVINRPTVETTASGATTSDRWNTDHVNAHVGFVFGVF
jgi:hypothetical protein